MNVYLYHPVKFETWDYRNPDTVGIGGSETHQIEVAWRLARRGYNVISYAPIPDDCDPNWRGTTWKRLEEADFTQPGLWLIYRHPPTLDKFEKEHPDQKVWLISQDEFYETFTPERVEKLDTLVALCPDHAASLARRCPYVKDKIKISSNGIKVDLIREIESGPIPDRNPFRIIHTSSPDRSLMTLLPVFRRAREYIPQLELHLYYGFDNIDKLIASNEKYRGYVEFKKRIQSMMDQPNVFWHGRMNQKDLYYEFLKSGIYAYPTSFTETSCISVMEAQALGAIPIVSPVWALKTNAQFGIHVLGPERESLTRCKFAAEIVRLAGDFKLQHDIRGKMMGWARHTFNWDRACDQFESWLYGYEDRFFVAQFNYQLKNAKGKILNIGCDIDSAKFREHGAVNMDAREVQAVSGLKNPVDIVGDIRIDLPEKCAGKFDTVILGDILEHLSDLDAIKTLINASKGIKNGGYIVITCPDDRRPKSVQHPNSEESLVEDDAYGDGESRYHSPVPKERLEGWIHSAGLKLVSYEKLDYAFAEGHGALCEVIR